MRRQYFFSHVIRGEGSDSRRCMWHHSCVLPLGVGGWDHLTRIGQVWPVTSSTTSLVATKAPEGGHCASIESNLPCSDEMVIPRDGAAHRATFGTRRKLQFSMSSWVAVFRVLLTQGLPCPCTGDSAHAGTHPVPLGLGPPPPPPVYHRPRTRTVPPGPGRVTETTGTGTGTGD